MWGLFNNSKQQVKFNLKIIICTPTDKHLSDQAVIMLHCWVELSSLACRVYLWICRAWDPSQLWCSQMLSQASSTPCVPSPRPWWTQRPCDQPLHRLHSELDHWVRTFYYYIKDDRCQTFTAGYMRTGGGVFHRWFKDRGSAEGWPPVVMHIFTVRST